MKFRLRILLLLAIFVALFSMVRRPPHRPIGEYAPRASATNSTSVAQFRQSSAPSNPTLRDVVSKLNPLKYMQEKEAAEKRIEAMNRPIDFYGQTVDQDGNPLPGVRIKIAVVHMTAGFGYSIHLDRTSDANGQFDIHDAKVTGHGFDIESMSKSGYEPESKRRGYGPVGGAFGDPMIFRFWRTEIKQPLITGERTFSIRPDGISYVIDFSKGIISEAGTANGDLKLQIDLLPPLDGRYPHWSCDFRPVNGSLCEETDSSSPMYLAPTSGYTNGFSFTESPETPWNRSSGTLRFYLRLKDGKEYGRVAIDMAMWASRTNLLRVDYAINPTGSRILR